MAIQGQQANLSTALHILYVSQGSLGDNFSSIVLGTSKMLHFILTRT